MRITTRLLAAGKRSLTRIPMANSEMKDCLGADGKLDRAKAQLAFAVPITAEYNPFMPDKSDDVIVYYAAMTYLELFHDAYAQVIDDDRADCNAKAVTRQDEVLERRIDRGRYVFSRMDVKRTGDGVRVRLSYANPKEVVGESLLEARTYTVTCAQMWLRMKEQMPWLTVEADADVLAEAEENNRLAADRRRYADCPRRTNGYCSPISPECPFYRNGKCTMEG